MSLGEAPLRLVAVSAGASDPSNRGFVMLDADPAPGGAWQHRWESLHMATVNGIFDLPDFPKPPIDPEEPSRRAVPAYFAAFEQQERLPILRPVVVTAVRRADDDPERETFTGRQLHTRDYVSADDFSGQRVAVVGGGISAVQLLEEISRVATTYWYTRREPVFRDGDFRPEVEGREIIARVTADAEAGLPRAVSCPTRSWRGFPTPSPPPLQALTSCVRRFRPGGDVVRVDPYAVRTRENPATTR